MTCQAVQEGAKLCLLPTRDRAQVTQVFNSDEKLRILVCACVRVCVCMHVHMVTDTCVPYARMEVKS